MVLNTGPLNWESSVLTTSYCSMIVKLTKLTTGVGNQGNNKFKGLICGIRESLWFVSPHITTFEARSSSIPSILSKLCPLNDPTRHKHYARKLEKNALLLLLSGIKTKLEKLCFSIIFQALQSIDLLTEPVYKFIDYLGKVSEIVSAGKDF